MVDHAPKIRRLSDCSFEDAVQIWNDSFKGYVVDMTLSLDGYVARLHNEGLSSEYSFIAFCSGKPAGILLNGSRSNAGKKVAWKLVSLHKLKRFCTAPVHRSHKLTSSWALFTPD